jgi:glycosyltransferase involved in cell wall biosynthesis
MAPVASIVLLAYNHERFVEEALSSALAQDFRDFELLVFDDASTDSTRAKIEAFFHARPDLDIPVKTVFHDRNLGLLATVNEALALVKGEYFIFLAGDDVALPDRLSRTLAAFTANPEVRMVWGEYVRIDEKGRRLGVSASPEVGRVFSYDRGPLFRIYAGAAPMGASAGYHRSTYDRFGPLVPGSHGEDNCLLVRALLLGSAYLSPETLICWRQHGGNLSNFSTDVASDAWRQRHLRWMDSHATMSAQWRRDIDCANKLGLITWFRGLRLRWAASREDAAWALSASSLRCDPWPEWSGHAGRLLLLGRPSTVLKSAWVRLSPSAREKTWIWWAKMKSGGV